MKLFDAVNSLVARVAPGLYRGLKHRKMKSFYSQFFAPGDLCFDCGANTGNYTDIFLELGGRVIAIEPVSSSLATLGSRWRDGQNPVIVRKALGAMPGTATIAVSKLSEISSLSPDFISYYKTHYDRRWETSEPVDVTTLDALIRQYGVPVFCKIDVEGYEPEVIRGLTSQIPAIAFEFNYPFREKARECILHLMTLGHCTFNYSAFENFRFELRAWVNGTEMIARLHDMPPSVLTGDIYIRFVSTGQATAHS